MSHELLTELLKRYSPSEQEAAAVAYLVGWMAEHDFYADIDEVGNACGMRGNPDAPHTLMLLGHIDTVKGDIPVRMEDGKLYGRGSVDAKGSLCTFAAATAQARIPDNWRVMVIGAVEEEISTSKGAYHIRDHQQPPPDMCIIGEPSGAERITLGYKGRLLLKYHYSRSMTHTALPEPSAGAVGADLWHTILDWSAIHNRGIERLFDQITPHLHEINTSSDGFTESVQMTIGFRLPPRMQPEGVLAALQLMAEGDVIAYGSEQAYQGEKNNPLVRGMLAAIRGQGGDPGFVLKSGTSDMNVVGAVWGCPIVAYGPGDSQLDHTPNEHLELAEYDKAIATLTAFIEGL
jgi:[amino group carrier protein]-lysine/ornithine hydrolase